MDASTDEAPVATDQPVRRTGRVVSHGRHFSVVHWDDGSSSIVGRESLADMEALAACSEAV